jgi:hypothetical protein
VDLRVLTAVDGIGCFEYLMGCIAGWNNEQDGCKLKILPNSPDIEGVCGVDKPRGGWSCNGVRGMDEASRERGAGDDPYKRVSKRVELCGVRLTGSAR